MDATTEPTAASAGTPTTPWWQQGVIYQVYPRSFQDHDGDGVGDLDGIRIRLDHLVDLGVDAVWVSPIFPSPMADFGYDISDYLDIDPLFGSLADFDRLLAAAHDRGLKLLLDLVPSHTSQEHPWFVASRSSRSDPQRDWYVWRDAAADGGPPNNWLSEFGGPAWTWDEATGQYYLNIYLKEQPALNWRNPQVRAAMFDVMRFWFDRGVDGFRIDAVGHLVMDEQFRDNPLDPAWTEGNDPATRLLRHFTAHQPETYAVAREMRRIADAYDGDRLLIGEAYGPLERVMDYYGSGDLDGFHLPFNFQLIGAAWDAPTIARIVEEYEAALPNGAWPNWVLGNHDRSRIASRAGPAQVLVAATLLLTLRGTPTIYQGDELGMSDVRIPPDAVRDPWELQVPGLGLGRDPVRTPIPWDDGPNHGFTTGTPWLPLGTDTPSVTRQRTDASSPLAWYRKLLALRRDEPALVLGSFRTRTVSDGAFVYERRHAGRCLVVALNLTGSDQPADVPRELLLSTHGADDAPQDLLRPNEARITVWDG